MEPRLKVPRRSPSRRPPFLRSSERPLARRLEPRSPPDLPAPFVRPAITSRLKAPPLRSLKTVVRTFRITLGRAMRAIRTTRKSLIRKPMKIALSRMSARSILIRKFRSDGARSRCNGTTAIGGSTSTTAPRMVLSRRSSVSITNIVDPTNRLTSVNATPS